MPRRVELESSQDVFRPGSASPSAILFEASELFEKRSPKADEFIRSIKSDLVAAVDTCIDAAGREYEVVWQKKLLRVSHGADAACRGVLTSFAILSTGCHVRQDILGLVQPQRFRADDAVAARVECGTILRDWDTAHV